LKTDLCLFIDLLGFFFSYVVVTFLSNRHQTPVAKRTISPEYPVKDSTWDYPIHLSLAESLGAVEFVIWDKDLIKKDYLGEVSHLLSDWFNNGNRFRFDDPLNTVSPSPPFF